MKLQQRLEHGLPLLHKSFFFPNDLAEHNYKQCWKENSWIEVAKNSLLENLETFDPNNGC